MVCFDMDLGTKDGPFAFIQRLGEKCFLFSGVTLSGLGEVVARKGLVEET